MSSTEDGKIHKVWKVPKDDPIFSSEANLIGEMIARMAKQYAMRLSKELDEKMVETRALFKKELD